MIKITNVHYLKSSKEFGQIYGEVYEKEFWVKSHKHNDSGIYIILTYKSENDMLYDPTDELIYYFPLTYFPAYFGVIEPDDTFNYPSN